MLTDKKIILGICGSIAAYKSVEWVRELRRAGAEVRVVMTKDATRFVSPLTYAALSGNKVYEGMFDPTDAEQIPHINLAAEADLILVGPATAQTISRFAHGMADDLLSALVLANQSPVIVCPAMNTQMYVHPATQSNLGKLRDFGYRIVEPGTGKMACDSEGPGRLAEWDTVKESVYSSLSIQDMSGQKVLVTGGPTREFIDPVRYIGNRSSGRMGHALAITAKRRGAEVTLVSGPTSLPDPPGVEIIKVTSAAEMAEVVLANADKMSVIVKAAAVSDFRPKNLSLEKIKKSKADQDIALIQNKDILKCLGDARNESGKPEVLIGFAAESHNMIAEGQRKLAEKNLDLLVLNDITSEDAGFEVDTNRVIILDRNGGDEKLPLLSKEETGNLIWNRAVKLLSD